MLISLLLAGLTAFAREGPQRILDPTHYRSPDATSSLLVDPSSPDGAGPARYELRRGAELVWQAEKPWTLWQATVTEQGFTAGYAYTRGLRDPKAEGEFHAVILRPDGSVLLDQGVRREASRDSDTAPGPFGHGVFHVPELGRVVFRVRDTDSNRSSEEWWCFAIPSGKELWRKRPRENLAPSVNEKLLVGVEAVPGTPLTLVEWRRSEHASGGWTLGVHLALLDAELEPVWEDVRADDCTLPDAKQQDLVNRELIARGTLVAGLGPRRFGVISPARGERAVYEVAQGAEPGAWAVREVERAPHVYLPDLSVPELPTVRLELRREIRLGGAPSASQAVREIRSHAVREIRAFDFAGAGALRVVRGEKQPGSFTLLEVDGSGAVQSEREVELEVGSTENRIAWWSLGADRWLATQTPETITGKTTVWVVEPGERTARRLEAFDCPRIDRVAALPGAGFVVLATEHDACIVTEHLIAFDADGRKQWDIAATPSRTHDSLFSPDDVATTSDGRVVVVDSIRKAVQVFATDGKFVRHLDLSKAWGRKANHPCRVVRDLDGGVMVFDINGDPPLVRMRADGTVRAYSRTVWPDGRAPSQLPFNARVAPDGRVWTHDGSRILRLDEQGVVELVVGEPLDPDVLADPCCGAIDVFGRMLVQDQKSAGVHVFDGDGKALFVCRPDPSDFRNVSGIMQPTSTIERGVLVPGGRNGWLRFGADGTRVGSAGRLPRALLFSPHSGLACGVVGGPAETDVLVLLDEKLERVVEIARRPDRCWLAEAGDPAIGPDGTIGIVASKRRSGNEVEDSVIALYSPRGEAQRQIALPARFHYKDRLALGRRWAVISGFGKENRLVDLETGAVSRFEIEGQDDESAWSFAFAPEDEALFALDARGTRVLHLALPR